MIYNLIVSISWGIIIYLDTNNLWISILIVISLTAIIVAMDKQNEQILLSRKTNQTSTKNG